MELYLLRHGEAGTRVPTARDSERALTASGKEEIEKVAKSLASQKYVFDVVASSPLKRAKDTASIVNKALKRKGDVEEWHELSPEGSKAAFFKRLSKLRPTAAVLCVGHEPYLTTTIGEVVGMGGERLPGSRIVLRKGGMAKLVVVRFTPKVSGELRWLLTPKQLKRLA
ncbi:MAG: phosphohistidine phosphatase SixA [Nitrososphaerota archaeon]|nr:phosphohistidine phosphatase SixA [Nitrososphaerota archaeon]